MTARSAFIGHLKPVEAGALSIDPARFSARWKGQAVTLPPGAFVVLCALTARAGIVLTRDQILDAVGDDGGVYERSIDSQVKRIRAAFRAVDPEFHGIEGIYGWGYRWRDEG